MTEILIVNKTENRVPFCEQPRHRLLKSKRNMDDWVDRNDQPNYDYTTRQGILLEKLVPLPKLDNQFLRKLEQIKTLALFYDAQLLYMECIANGQEQFRRNRRWNYAKQFDNSQDRFSLI